MVGPGGVDLPGPKSVKGEKMKRFAVSSTFHQIDYLALDATRLHLVEAKDQKEAVRKVLCEDMLEMEVDTLEEVRSGQDDESCLHYGVKKEDLQLDAKTFLERRRTYWMKKPIASDDDYPFYFDDQDGWSGGVYGFQVKEIPKEEENGKQ